VTADLTSREAAKLLGVSASWLRRHGAQFERRRQAGRSGGEWRYSRDSLEQFRRRGFEAANPFAGKSVAEISELVGRERAGA